jgi:CelD/BcsL family acetyltransferase involved in cellulose biosynthesis
MRMRIREIDPIHDPGWLDLVERHPRASVFHTPGWLEALRRTYGYEPVVLTTSPPERDLATGIVFCRVSSWLTGHRLVSLPFSDHCEPLVDDYEELGCILAALRAECSTKGWKYIEIRAADFDLGVSPDLSKSKTFCLHRLDLHPSLEDLFRGFHEDCVRRKIRRAEREGLAYEEGRSEPLLEKFYRLLVLTRRRQLLLPQPLAWFRHLIAWMGDKLKIRVASKDGQPVASILTLRYKATLVYKYGCSDPSFNKLGGTQLIFWKAIQEAKSNGLRELDLGRSDWSNPGLIKFKDRWGAPRSTLTYWRYGAVSAELVGAGWNTRIGQRIFGYMPDGLLTSTAALLYRHVG